MLAGLEIGGDVKSNGKLLSKCRKAVVYEGPHPAEGHLPVHGPAEEQHGIWFHDYWRRRA